MDGEMLKLVLIAVGPMGAAWIGVKTSLNGVREDVGEMRKDLKSLVKSDAEQDTAIAVHDERIDTLEKNQTP